MAADAIAALSEGCGRGFTVLCTIPDAALLDALVTACGPTGLVLLTTSASPRGDGWRAVRCDPARSLPLRSHIADAAIIADTADLPRLVEEVRRALAPGGEVRVYATGAHDIDAALIDAAIRPSRIIRLADGDARVVVARGP